MSNIELDPKGLIRVCASCGQRNRIPFSTPQARCGQCKADLPPPGEPIDVPGADMFDALVSSVSQPVVVDFWAPWCGPCRMVAPELERVAAANAGRLIVVKVNTDQVSELGDRFGIRSIPTMAVFHGGKEVARTTGAMPADRIEAFVRSATASA
jgi:thioredoxin 2